MPEDSGAALSFPFLKLLAGAAPIFLLAVAYFIGCLTTRLVVTVGGFSQIAGFGLVVFLIGRTHRSFGAESLLARLKGWAVRTFRRLKGWAVRTFRRRTGKQPPSQAVSAHPATGRFEAGGAVPTVTASGESLEDKVERLERQLGDLDTKLNQKVAKLQDKDRETVQEIARERQNRREDADALKSAVRNLALGNTSFELTGIAWFVLGVVFVTWPDWIAGFF